MMTWSFGDGFDLYALAADATGYWDTVGGAPPPAAGRFAGSRGFTMNNTGYSFTKSSGVNDAVHHIIIAFIQTSALSGANIGVYLQLLDGVTGQCAVCFRQDGTILLNAGSAAGANISTYPNAFLQNIWTAFEFEIVINNSTGSFTVRKNGNTSTDFTQSGLNTRGSANNYANKLILGCNTSSPAANIDDIFWRSDISAVGWMGDMRCYTRMPGSDISTQFARSPASFFVQTTSATAGTSNCSAHNIRATSMVSPTTGTVASLTFNFSTGATGHARMALYDATGIGVRSGALLVSSAEITNPVSGVNTFGVTAGTVVTRGTTYWVAIWSDVIITPAGNNAQNCDQLALTYTTAYPSTMAGSSNVNSVGGLGSNGMNITPTNTGCVNDPQQDGTTSYVYDNTIGDSDFYGLSPLNTPTPASVVAVTTRGYLAKSDSGGRSATVRFKSGGITVPAPSIFLASSFLWAWRTDFTDPNTSTTWTPTGVNNMQIGPIVVS